MGTLDENKPIDVENSKSEGSPGSLNKKKNKKKKNLSKQKESSPEKSCAKNGLEQTRQSSLSDSIKPLSEGSSNKAIVMGKKKRKMKEDNKEDVVSKKTKIKPDDKEGITETQATEKNDDKVGSVTDKSTWKEIEGEKGVEAVSAKKKKKGKKKKKNTGSQVNDEPALKKFKEESEKSSELDLEKIDTNGVGAKKKKRGKKKKRTSITAADEVKEGSDSQVNDEPALKKLKVESGKVDFEKSDVDGATSKKKKKQGSSITEVIEVKEERKELSSVGANGEEQKKKKRNKKKKQKAASENCNVTDITEESSEKGKSTDGSQGVSEKLKMGKKEKKEVSKAESFMPLSSTAKSQKKKNAMSGGSGKDASNVAISINAKLNEVYNDGPHKDEMIKCWGESLPLQKDNGCKLLSEPFKCMYMPQFLQDANFLNEVKDELSNLELHKKSNDLYKFKQTSDLKSVSSPCIASLRKFLYGDFRNWLSDVTGIELNNKVDMSSSRYDYTDVLLCHDDELEGRRVAYILYLTPPWYEKDGGTLDLFDVDNKGQPRDIVESLLPKWNTFAFFEVSPVSFHQVREVLARDKVRLSINGWFHGPNIKRPSRHVEPPREFLSPVHFEEDELYAWINPTYLDAETQRQIRKKFQSDSEIELESFICEEKYEELSKAIQSSMKWVGTGPANKQSCKVLKQGKQGKLPGVLAECVKFLKSEALFLVLSQLTGLKLHRLAPPDSDPDSEDEEESEDSNPGVIIDIRQWSYGCYTLLRDCDQTERTSSLDASLFVNVSSKWNLEHGGFTSFIAKDEDEELLTVLPRSNCFALVYRDAETLKFTKYINASVKDLGYKDSVYYELNCTYRE